MSESSSGIEIRSGVIRGVLFDIAPSLITYYGLRALGTSEYVALLFATLVAGAKVLYDAIKARRLDPFAGYLVLRFGLSLAVGLATSDARMLLAGNALVSGIGALIFLGSCVIQRPLTQVVADRIRPDAADGRETVEPGLSEFKRRVHIGLSAMWGVGLLVGVAVNLAIIFSLPVDVAKGLDTAVSLALTAALVVASIAVSKRAAATWEQRTTAQG